MNREAAMTLWRNVALGSPDGAVTGRMIEEFAEVVKAAERERWAKAFDGMREKTLAAQAGPESELANVMLRQLAELGFGECSRALRA